MSRITFMTLADTKSPPSEIASPPPRFLRVRLAVQIFLAFAIMGAWLPVFTLYLTKQLGFSTEATA
jgi:hypothetical protein